MGVLLQGFYKLPPGRAVPSPADGDAATPWWWDHLAMQANAFRKAGFTAIWLPPVLKTSAGSRPGSDGYGPFDDYDIGSKDQMGTVPTRFGSREQLQRCVAVLRANGLDVYLDMVEHHRSGDPGNFIFRYKGADGRPGIGRFPKDPLNFVPNVPRDPDLGGPARDDFPFGRELAPINGKPPGYVFDGLVDAADWLTRALDVQGYRLDDVKGLSTDFLFPFLTRKAMTGKFAFGEYFDGDRTLVSNWVFNPRGMRGRASAFDFPLRFALAAMCNNPGRFNMAELDHAGLAGVAPFNAVTFVENHDTDLKEPVVTNKILAYAYILTSEGYPCVYYRDYSTDRNCFGLKQPIDNLIWIHEKLAAGPARERWKDFNLFAYERLGEPGLLVALNNDPGAARTIEVATAFGANVALHDYTGHGPDLVTTGQGNARITVPRNADGRGYVCYSRTGIDGGFAIGTRAVTQEFEGAADLDLAPAGAGKPIRPGRVWCDRDKPIRAVLGISGLADSAEAVLEITGPDDGVVASRRFGGEAAAHAALDARTKAVGFHALRLSLNHVPNGAAASYKLAVSYTASKELPAEATKIDQDSADPRQVGRWDRPFALPNVAIHTHLLPNGKVLFWGRREEPNGSLDEHFCTPHIWDPAAGETRPTPRPMRADGKTTVNLFCSGHTFLADGRLLVVGGHIADGKGLDQAATYDWRTDSWTALPVMNAGRWYPSAVTLHDGSALVMSGSFADANNNTPTNEVQQVWDGDGWRSLVNFHGMQLYPRVHAAPNGRAFMSGPLAQTYMLDTEGPGNWTPLAGAGGSRAAGQRDYAPSVMYDVGKVIYIGGGNDPGTLVPTPVCEIIDLNSAAPAWRATAAMHHPRRQHNATILPDGTVLVTGGTAGSGFNGLTPGQPVHTAELWDPHTGEWTELAAEAVDRCYHSTAILLPDATVLSAGGGEFRPDKPDSVNDPKDSHRDAQIFHPPYLFRGARPDLTVAPAEVSYGQSFIAGTSHPEEIGGVSLVRLSSVTHSCNMDQRINFLGFRTAAGGVSITVPEGPDLCPPGHYMLFLLSRDRVPSVAKILRIAAPAAPRRLAAVRAAAPEIPEELVLSTAALDDAVRSEASGTHAVIGLTSRCPYGLGACWGGAYEALQQLDGVQSVRPIANAEHSTADVYLRGNMLPDVDRWAAQITSVANGSYDFRGIEVSLQAVLREEDGELRLHGPAIGETVTLAPLEGVAKVQFDRATLAARPATAEEIGAYRALAAKYRDAGSADFPVRVTGPLKNADSGRILYVRAFEN